MRRPALIAAVVVATASPAYAAPDLDAVVKPAPTCDAARTRCVGLALHVAVGKDGAIAKPDFLVRQLAAANHHFEQLDLGFQIVSVDALPESALVVEDRKERDSFAPQVKGKNIHVFVTGDLVNIDTDGNTVYGVTWRARSASPGSAGARSAAQRRGGTIDTKFIIISTQSFERTLAHELGHVFGLPHSTYPISIMNKTARTQPPVEQRTFDPKEVAAMKPRITWMLRAKLLENLKNLKPRQGAS